MELALFLPATTGMGVARNAAAVVVDLAVDPPPQTLQPQSSVDAVALPGLGQLRRRIECGDSDAKPSLIKNSNRYRSHLRIRGFRQQV